MEIYVILAVIAAAVLVMAWRPGGKGEVSEHLVAGDIYHNSDGQPDMPEVEFRVLDSGRVVLVRRGLSDSGVSSAGAVSLAVTMKGSDVRIEERLTPGQQYGLPVDTAMFSLDFLRPYQRYNIVYNSQGTGLFVAFTLHTRPGIVATRGLAQ